MSTKFFTNQGEDTLYKKIIGVLEQRILRVKPIDKKINKK